MQDIFCYFSKNISQNLSEYFKGQPDDKISSLEEIRLRTNKNLILKFTVKEEILDIYVTPEDILETLQIACDNSIYSYQNQICNGYITVRGGHRIGVVGNCVTEKNKVININYISGLNFRIAKQIIGCSKNVLDYVLKEEENTVYNTLIVSPPGVRENYNFKRYCKEYKLWN